MFGIFIIGLGPASPRMYPCGGSLTTSAYYCHTTRRATNNYHGIRFVILSCGRYVPFSHFYAQYS